ncbi:hypothetical protein LSPH26S_02209 [Lysinibacillus sphaericus]
MGAHGPLEGHAHPVRVRRGLRSPRRTAERDQRLRLGPHAAGLARVRGGGPDRPGARRGRLRGHHGRRPRRHGGGQQGRQGGQGRLRGPRHRAPLRAGAQPARRHRR